MFMTGQEVARQGGDAERNRLVEENMGFVVAMAKQYVGKGVALDDLVSEGYIGLIKAAGKYDGSKGAKFTSYAASYVRKSIMQALAGSDRRYNDNASARLESMDGGGSSTDDRVEQGTATADVVAALGGLSERERSVVTLCFGIDGPQMTFAEVGEKLGITRERVRQIRKKAVRHLRRNSGDAGLKTLLG